jgi:hypothetical protein
MRKGIEQAADKGSFLSLDQLAEFVQEAMRAGAEGSEIVQARVSFGGKLQKITLTLDTTKE